MSDSRKEKWGFLNRDLPVLILFWTITLATVIAVCHLKTLEKNYNANVIIKQVMKFILCECRKIFV